MDSSSNPTNLLSLDSLFSNEPAKYFIVRVNDSKNIGFQLERNDSVMFTEIESPDSVIDKTGLQKSPIYRLEEKYFALLPLHFDSKFYYWKLGSSEERISVIDKLKIDAEGVDPNTDLRHFLPYKLLIEAIEKSPKLIITHNGKADVNTRSENSGKKVTIEEGIKFHPEEKIWVDKIFNSSKEKLGRWAGIPNPSKGLRIGIAASGGGLPAAIAARFFTHNLSQVDRDFFSSISYFCGLSGSSLFLTDWCFNGEIFNNNDQLMSRDHIGKINGNTTLNNLALVFSKLHEAIWDMTPFSGVKRNNFLLEHLALLMGAAYFPNDYKRPNFLETHRLSTLKSKLKSEANPPWPIMTCISSEDDANKANINWRNIQSQKESEFPFQWVEFTPEQVCHVLRTNKRWRAIIPSAFGCIINENGLKEDSLSQDSLAQLLALWGSALALTRSEYANQTDNPFGDDGSPAKQPSTSSLWKAYLSLGEKFIATPFTFPSWEDSSKELCFRDAGLAFNIPFPPLLVRDLDIILALDASSDLETNCGGNEIIKAALWAERNGFQFPVTHEELIIKKREKKLLKPAIFQKPGAPTVVYLPVIPKSRIDFMDLDTSDFTKRKSAKEAVEEMWKSISEELKQKVKEMIQ